MARVPPETPAYRLVRPAPRPAGPELDRRSRPGRPPGRPAAGARRAGHRQDHHAGRGGRRPDRAARARPRAGARADLQPQGGAGAAASASPPGWAARPRSARPHLPLLRLRRCCAARPRCAGEPAPRLLSGPEQDLVVRDLLAGELEDGARPAGRSGCAPALPTRGFAQELRDLLMRGRTSAASTRDRARAARPPARPRRLARRGPLLRQYAGVDRAAPDAGGATTRRS